ncbi:hypothetical protein S245_064420 [Arachis hypogaea]|nr:uncharacterized protein DS421_18g629490 [Arachis hypogaea]
MRDSDILLIHGRFIGDIAPLWGKREAVVEPYSAHACQCYMPWKTSGNRLENFLKEVSQHHQIVVLKRMKGALTQNNDLDEDVAEEYRVYAATRRRMRQPGGAVVIDNDATADTKILQLW